VSISKRVRVDIPIVGDLKGRAAGTDRADSGGARQARLAGAVGLWGQINDGSSAPGLKSRTSPRVSKPSSSSSTSPGNDEDRDTTSLPTSAAADAGPRQYYRFEHRDAGSLGGLGAMGVVCLRDGHQACAKTDRDVSALPAKLDPDLHPAVDLPAVKTPGKDRLANTRYLAWCCVAEIDYAGVIRTAHGMRCRRCATRGAYGHVGWL